jgi:hypothetical protein
LGRLRLQAEELYAQQYPGNHLGPKYWLNLVGGLLDTADSYLTSSRTTSDANAAITLARDAARLCSLAYQCMSLMNGSSIAHLSPPIVTPFQRWLDTLGFKNTALFRAETAANYELVRIDEKSFSRIRDAAPSLTSAIDDLNWPLFRITLPTKGFAIIPHFSIVAHEIGHALLERVNWDLAGFAAEEACLIQRIQAKAGGAPLSPEAIGILKQVFISWFNELASDAFAYLLTGPAIFFSLCDFFQLLGNGYGLCLTHPANDIRRRALFMQLVDTSSGKSFAQVFEKHTACALDETFNSGILIPTPDKTAIWADVKSGGADDMTATILSELHESLPFLISTIHAQAKSHLVAAAPQTIYTPDKYDADLDAHLQPMLAAIPPIESPGTPQQVPSHFETILNVGWVTLLTKFEEFRVTTDGSTNWERMEILHSLLEKAVELSEVKRLWESVP